MRLDNGKVLVIERVNTDVARIYLRDSRLVQVPLANVVVNDMAGNPVRPFLENIMITWAGSYRVFLNDKEVFSLRNQKQQAVLAADLVFFSEPPSPLPPPPPLPAHQGNPNN